MRDPIDVLRSVKRHMALVLGSDWEVRLDDEMEVVPFCFVSRTTPVTETSPTQHLSTFSMGVRAVCYLGPKASEEEALIALGAVERTVLRGLKRGEVGGGRNLRIPLYDYSAVGMDAAATVDERINDDWVRLTALSLNTLADPEDRRSQSLIVTFTAGWRQVADLDTSGVTVESVTAASDPGALG